MAQRQVRTHTSKYSNSAARTMRNELVESIGLWNGNFELRETECWRGNVYYRCMKCEGEGVRTSKCTNKITKPDWVHTSLELCKRKNKGKCVFRCTESASVHHRAQPWIYKPVVLESSHSEASALLALLGEFRCLHIACWIFVLILVLKHCFYLILQYAFWNFTTYLIPDPW